MNRRTGMLSNTGRTVAGAFALALLVAVAGGLSAAEDTVQDRLQQGKETFVKKCGLCHPITYALDESYSRDDWTMTVNMMVDNGAKFEDEEKSLIIDYLTVKSTFENKCSVCHGLDRPLSKTKTLQEWKSTVSRMAGKRQGHLSPEEVEAIAAFLALGYPKPKK